MENFGLIKDNAGEIMEGEENLEKQKMEMCCRKHWLWGWKNVEEMTVEKEHLKKIWS